MGANVLIGLSKNDRREHRVGLEPTFPHYGCGVLAAERPVRVMGSDGLEPSPARVRTGCAAANTLIPNSFAFRRSARRESNPRRALIRSLLSPLSYEPFTPSSRFQ